MVGPPSSWSQDRGGSCAQLALLPRRVQTILVVSTRQNSPQHPFAGGVTVLAKIGLLLLIAWPLAYAFTDWGSAVHILLLTGLLLLLLGLMKARDGVRPGSEGR
jgi:hypothetical protein